MTLDPLRLVTIHPLLVHFTIGLVPLVVLSYALAAYRRSPGWTFVGDVGACLGAGLTLAALAFGLVSNAVVPWPGGIEQWRWLHLVGGAVSSALFLALAGGRLRARRAAPTSGRAALVTSVALAAVVGATGWIGGEVLVFHSGMAVKAAGNGALAPRISASTGEPRDMLDAMGQIRGSWAAASTRVASMIVEEPQDTDFRVVAQESDRMATLAGWLVDRASSTGKEGRGTAMARDFRTWAQALSAAAGRRDVTATTRTLGSLETTCAHCHEETRWESHHQVASGAP
jgi:uncharacterized membrane protein